MIRIYICTCKYNLTDVLRDYFIIRLKWSQHLIKNNYENIKELANCFSKKDFIYSHLHGYNDKYSGFLERRKEKIEEYLFIDVMANTEIQIEMD